MKTYDLESFLEIKGMDKAMIALGVTTRQGVYQAIKRINNSDGSTSIVISDIDGMYRAEKITLLNETKK